MLMFMQAQIPYKTAIEDIVQLYGKSSQYHVAINNARALTKELGNSELTFVGHSLGGGEATADSMATGKLAITFNSAVVSKATIRNEELMYKPKVKNYRTIGSKIGLGNFSVGGDILNNAQEKVGLILSGITIGVPTGFGPNHGIDNFLKTKLQ
ncbi:MAG: hypothetical protein NC116_07540 [Clostridium sp.]|nr:hypothetical protein [Clostridium sp.]